MPLLKNHLTDDYKPVYFYLNFYCFFTKFAEECMKKLIAGMVLGVTVFGGIGALYVVNTGCSNSHACQELVKKACTNVNKNKKKALVCSMWKKKVANGLDPTVCEENLKNLK